MCLAIRDSSCSAKPCSSCFEPFFRAPAGLEALLRRRESCLLNRDAYTGNHISAPYMILPLSVIIWTLFALTFHCCFVSTSVPAYTAESPSQTFVSLAFYLYGVLLLFGDHITALQFKQRLLSLKIFFCFSCDKRISRFNAEKIAFKFINEAQKWFSFS